MNAHFPDHDTIRTALSLATRAPSIHNTQPWRWRVGDESLHLYADPDRQLPNADPDSRDLLLSCGIALHHAVVALAALGWHAKVHRFPNPAQPQHLAAIEVRPRTAGEVDVVLAAAIPRRRTDRRLYNSWCVPEADIALMGARAARCGVMLREVAMLPKLQHIVAQAVQQHVSNEDYLRELTTWSGRHASLAGCPPATFRSRIRAPPSLAASSPVPRWPNRPRCRLRTTRRRCWRWGPRTTARWRGCAPVRRPA
ncbi:hypothetical protein MCEL_43050 [Mycolicibacterium celeriflavum]|uniref:NAD(P)H nitroreductase n=1 Tax=Mycolicibacterium celeriflavum TaxID=1249101 RepID=A0A7I7RNV3_MYCCF|nr:hypothetical protein MCEL_43050 [Mycolicibacterium celeriflavum]